MSEKESKSDVYCLIDDYRQVNRDVGIIMSIVFFILLCISTYHFIKMYRGEEPEENH